MQSLAVFSSEGREIQPAVEPVEQPVPLLSQLPPDLSLTDSATEGAWPNKYGTNGYDMVAFRLRQPSFPPMQHFLSRDLTHGLGCLVRTTYGRYEYRGGSGGIAAAWYHLGFQFNLTFTDGATHQLGWYAVDWTTRGGRKQYRSPMPTTGTILDSRSIASFVNGTYLVWDISGSVVIKVIGTSGPNGVVSAVFFDPVASGLAAPPPSAPTWIPQIALNWTVIPGATSYKVYRGLRSGGPYTVITSPSSPTYTDTSVVSGTAYFYVVTAVNSVGESPKSTELSSVAPKP